MADYGPKSQTRLKRLNTCACVTVLFSIFLRAVILFSMVAALFNMFNSFSRLYQTFVIFFSSHPGGCELVCHCGFDLNFFPGIGEYLFMCLLAISVPSLEKWLFKFFTSSCFFFFFSFIYISWRLITLQYCSGFCHALT